jgi:hypothetical protein
MEIVKSTFLGVWLFSFGTMGYLCYLYFALMHKLALIHKVPNGPGEFAPGVFAAYTVYSPVWWIGLMLCLALGFGIVRRAHVKPIVWIALIVTELLPVGVLSLFLILLVKVKEAAR